MHLAGADGASWPFWSPDNSAIGCFADGQLKMVDVVSGATRTVCQVPDSGTGRGGSWNGDDTIVFASWIRWRARSFASPLPEAIRRR